ncbi:MAG: dTMP kinase [Saprospiraceae bacterium]|nr:dTMP kinase [Saprospiraceae bacterium]MBP9208743.1 dTMP kinase [Saprospiraceae bacterium]MBV6472303.1 Thymidylate kinase [Saprospiraceae bacterium]
MKRSNLFIAFEGIDGSGKSTQLRLLADRLRREGHRVYCTSEPTDSPIGSVIRNVFKHRIEADHRTIAALFAADRIDHLVNRTDGILAKLDEGFTVLCDRYYFSSYAYQGIHMPVDWVIEINAPAVNMLRPDLHIYIDLEPAESMRRVHNGRSSTELYETTENLRAVRQQYLDCLNRFRPNESWCLLSGADSPEEVAKAVWVMVAPLLVEREGS